MSLEIKRKQRNRTIRKIIKEKNTRPAKSRFWKYVGWAILSPLILYFGIMVISLGSLLLLSLIEIFISGALTPVFAGFTAAYKAGADQISLSYLSKLSMTVTFVSLLVAVLTVGLPIHAGLKAYQGEKFSRLYKQISASIILIASFLVLVHFNYGEKTHEEMRTFANVYSAHTMQMKLQESVREPLN